MVGFVIYDILYRYYIQYTYIGYWTFINERLLTMNCASFQELIKNIDYLIVLLSSRNVE